MLIQLLVNGIVMGAIYSMVALGFALVYNTTRIFHIAYAAIYMFAAYMFYSFYNILHVQILLSFLVAIILTVILSLFIELVVYRPLENKGSSLNVIMISSIGVMIIIVNTVAMFFGNETKIINQEIASSVSFGNVILTNVQIAQFVVSAFVIFGFLLILKYTKLGIQTRAMRDDDILCSVFGIDSKKLRLILLNSLFGQIKNHEKAKTFPAPGRSGRRSRP